MNKTDTDDAMSIAEICDALQRDLSAAQERIKELEEALRNPTNETLAAMMAVWDGGFGTPYTRYAAMLNVAVDAALKK